MPDNNTKKIMSELMEEIKAIGEKAKVSSSGYWAHVLSGDKRKLIIIAGSEISKKVDNKTVKLPQARFAYAVTRFRKRTNVQYMEIFVIDMESQNDRAFMGEITTDLNSLSGDAKKFNEIGIIFSGPQYVEFCKTVRDNYYEFELQDEEEDSTLNLDGILVLFKEYFTESGESVDKRDIKAVGEVCVIPLADFDVMIKDSIYAQYTSVEIRQALREGGYIHCNTGSNSYVISKGGKKSRVVAFFKEQLDKLESLDSKQ